MNGIRRSAIAVVSAALLGSTSATGAAGTGATKPYKLGERLKFATAARRATLAYEVITWEQLLPRGWSTEKLIDELKLKELDDADPRVRERMAKLRQEWNEAPANAAMNEKRIRIAGFIVPLDANQGKLREFLLVPYFGACIHMPPPPANQIIHVTLAQPVSDPQLKSAAWVNGVLRIQRNDLGLATTGYSLIADKVESFQREWSPI